MLRNGNYSRAKYYYRTNDGREFSISENDWQFINVENSISANDWQFINVENSISGNLIQSPFTVSRLKKLSQTANLHPKYNWLFHPSTLEGTNGDHVLITEQVRPPETIITEENLETKKLEVFRAWSSNGKVEKLELELVNRHEGLKLPKSAHCKVFIKYPNSKQCLTEEYFVIQTHPQDVVVSFQASQKNLEHYQKIMFEIVDSIELMI